MHKHMLFISKKYVAVQYVEKIAILRCCIVSIQPKIHELWSKSTVFCSLAVPQMISRILLYQKYICHNLFPLTMSYTVFGNTSCCNTAICVALVDISMFQIPWSDEWSALVISIQIVLTLCGSHYHHVGYCNCFEHRSRNFQSFQHHQILVTMTRCNIEQSRRHFNHTCQPFMNEIT